MFQIGRFSNASNATSCDGVCQEPDTTIREGSTECDVCVLGHYLNRDTSTCIECPEGVDCSTSLRGRELTTLTLKPGWYRPTFKSKEMYRCRSRFACIGGDGNSSGGDEIEPNYW